MPIEFSIEDDIAIIKLGSADEKTVVLNEDRILGLDQALNELEKNKGLKGAIFIGPSATSFCAGADVGSIKSIMDLKQASILASRGQSIINKISELNIPTIAAVGGFCVGGGCEIILACDYRIALRNDETRIGLPEVKLGILPGFGGSVRMPRLLGLPAALDIILQGKVIPADKAKRIGLVDLLVSSDSYDDLKNAAKDIALGKRTIIRNNLSIKDKFLTFTALGRRIVKNSVHKKLIKETKGNYPAPLAALNVCVDALGMEIKEGLALEIREVSKLIVSSESKSLVHLFQLSEKAKKLGRSASEQMQNINIGVLGGGVMGAGIAAILLEKGYNIVLCDIIKETRDRAYKHIRDYLSSRRYLKEEQRQAFLSKLKITDELKDFSNCGLVIEAIVEKLEVKQAVFKNLAEIVSSTTILASNTSSLSIDEISQSISNPERIVGMHFFNPAEKMPLVEIVRGKKTSDATIVKTAAISAKIGKFPVVVENVPGFLVNRVLSPYMAEASQLLAEGYSIEDIDQAAINFGMPMGPVRLLDEVGLDVAAKVQQEMTAAYGARMSAPKYLDVLIKLGRLGKKSGIGFYRYQDKTAIIDPEIYNILGLYGERKKSDSTYISERLIMPLVNESIRCLDESVAGAAGEEAAGQIDLATVMGIGFAPFRGGAIHYAETLGVRKFSGKLKSLAKVSEARFSASSGVQKRLENDTSFYSAI